MSQRFSLFLLLLCTFMVGALLCPKPANELQYQKCFANILMAPSAVITLNCDSSEFMKLTSFPSKIFEEDNVRQSRPGLSFLAFMATPLFKPLGMLLDFIKPQAQRNDSGRATLHPKEDAVAYAALIFLNMLMLLAGYWFYQTSLGISSPSKQPPISIAAFLISLYIIANEMVKLYILSPHTQLLNLTVPLISVWIAWRSYYTPLWSTRLGYGLAGTLGLLILVYANFIVPFAVFGSISMWQHWRTQKWERWGSFLMRALYMFLLFTTPSLLWYVTVRSITGSYYVHELTQGNYVTWIHESLRTGGISALIVDYLVKFWHIIKLAAPDSVPTLLLGGWTVLWALPYIARNPDFRKTLIERVWLALWVAFLFLGLLSSMGYYPPRLTYILVPVWWPVIGYIANETYATGRTLYSPQLFSWSLGIVLGLYSLWLLQAPWDFRLW